MTAPKGAQATRAINLLEKGATYRFTFRLLMTGIRSLSVFQTGTGARGSSWTINVLAPYMGLYRYRLVARRPFDRWSCELLR